MQPTSVLTKVSVWYEVRVLWAMKNYVKSHTMTLAFILPTDINQIFQMRYCTLLKVKRLQKCQRSKLEVEKNLPDQADRGCISLESGRVGNFLSTSNFDLWYFCSLLTYKSVQYLIWKIWFRSIWRMKARVIAWLLMLFMFAQNTLISYHTEVFVKTEVGCTVITKCISGKFLEEP